MNPGRGDRQQGPGQLGASLVDLSAEDVGRLLFPGERRRGRGPADQHGGGPPQEKFLPSLIPSDTGYIVG